MGTAKPMAEVAELDLRQVDAAELVAAFTGGAAAVAVRVDEGAIRGAAVSAGGAQASYADLDDAGPLLAALADAASRSRRTTRRRSGASRPRSAPVWTA